MSDECHICKVAFPIACGIIKFCISNNTLELFLLNFGAIKHGVNLCVRVIEKKKNVPIQMILAEVAKCFIVHLYIIYIVIVLTD